MTVGCRHEQRESLEHRSDEDSSPAPKLLHRVAPPAPRLLRTHGCSQSFRPSVILEHSHGVVGFREAGRAVRDGPAQVPAQVPGPSHVSRMGGAVEEGCTCRRRNSLFASQEYRPSSLLRAGPAQARKARKLDGSGGPSGWASGHGVQAPRTTPLPRLPLPRPDPLETLCVGDAVCGRRCEPGQGRVLRGRCMCETGERCGGCCMSAWTRSRRWRASDTSRRWRARAALSQPDPHGLSLARCESETSHVSRRRGRT